MIKVESYKEMPENLQGVSSDEAETIINVTKDDGQMSITTTDNIYYHKLLRLCAKAPAYYKAAGYETCEGQPQVGRFLAPKEFLSFRSVKMTRPALSEERKAAIAKRFAEARAAKAAKK